MQTLPVQMSFGGFLTMERLVNQEIDRVKKQLNDDRLEDAEGRRLTRDLEHLRSMAHALNEAFEAAQENESLG